MNTPWFLPLVVAGLFAVALPAHAQEEAEQEQRPLFGVELNQDPRIPVGKSAFIESEADAIGDTYLVEGLEVMQPISVGVYTHSPDDDVRVRIAKDDWDAPEREARTQDGRAELYFRTFDSFKIWVDASTPTRYELVVWVGDEIKIEPKSIAVAASEYAEPDMAGNARSSTGNPDEASARESSRGGVTLTWLELGLMLVVVVIAIAFVLTRLRRK